jgi:hypothetical protein
LNFGLAGTRLAPVRWHFGPSGIGLAQKNQPLAPSGSTHGVVGTRLGVVKFILDLAGLTLALAGTSLTPAKLPLGFARTSLARIRTRPGVSKRRFDRAPTMLRVASGMLAAVRTHFAVEMGGQID